MSVYVCIEDRVSLWKIICFVCSLLFGMPLYRGAFLPIINKVIYFIRKCACVRQRGRWRSFVPATMTLKLHTQICMGRICDFKGTWSQFWNQVADAREKRKISQLPCMNNKQQLVILHQKKQQLVTSSPVHQLSLV